MLRVGAKQMAFILIICVNRMHRHEDELRMSRRKNKKNKFKLYRVLLNF